MAQLPSQSMNEELLFGNNKISAAVYLLIRVSILMVPSKINVGKAVYFQIKMQFLCTVSMCIVSSGVAIYCYF
jgi:hypothetical protein